MDTQKQKQKRCGVWHWNQKEKLVLDIRAYRQSQKVISLRKGGRLYKCSINERDNVTIQNNNYDEIQFLTAQPHSITKSPLSSTNNYVNSLVEEAKIAMGLTP